MLVLTRKGMKHHVISAVYILKILKEKERVWGLHWLDFQI